MLGHIFKNKDSKVLYRELQPLNFEKDISFLMTTIKHKLDFFVHFELRLKDGIAKFQLTDKMIKPVLVGVVNDVLEALSPSYTSALMFYFTKDSLEDFVAERVMLIFYTDYAKFISDKNSSRIAKAEALLSNDGDDTSS